MSRLIFWNMDTVLSNDITVAGGTAIKAGTTLEQDYITTGSNTLAFDMTLAEGFGCS